MSETPFRVDEPDASDAQTDSTAFWLSRAAALVAVGYLAFHIFVLTAWPTAPLLFRTWHVGGIIVLASLIWLARDIRWSQAVVLTLLAAGAFVASVYLTVHVDQIEMRAGVVPRAADIVFATILLLVVLEATRRAAGLSLVVLAMLFLLYALFGNLLPQPFSHGGYSFGRLVTYLFTTNGIFGIPVGSSATFIYFFVVFGALLSMSGASDFMMKLALFLSGRAKGGTAKVSVVASGFFGMINGTSAGNVAATGSITIRMMTRSGFRREFAGAVEAVASSGGQILPPVMGAAAFLMVEMTGISYSNIILSAAIPALLYFLALFLMVHFEATHRNIGAPADVQIPSMLSLLKESYYLLPLAVLLVSLLGYGSSIIRAALLSLLTTLLISFLKRATAIGPRRLVEAALEGGRGAVGIAVTCACAGIVIGVLNITGLGVKLAGIILTLTDGVLWLTLIVTMLVTIVLGMGMPTVAAYAITGTVVAPALIRLGVEPMAAHLFIMFFAALSAITPPVALASYAAAAVANANVTKLSLLAVRLGLAGFVIPYIFVYHTGMLMIGSWSAIVFSTFTGVFAVFCMAVAIQLPCRTRLIRVAFAVSALLVIWPSLVSTAAGMTTAFVAVLAQRWHRQKEREMLAREE